MADTKNHRHHSNLQYLKDLSRGVAGSILFAFALFMTMEMWWIGFYLDPMRLVIFLVVTFAMLVPLSRFVGFEKTRSIGEDVTDAIVAFGIGIVASAVVLTIFALLGPGMPLDEVVGKIAVQAAPAAIGAMVARGQMGEGNNDRKQEEDRWGYPGELFLMAAGALFLALNVAPTEEMILIAFKMTPVHALVLIALSIATLHAFVYALDFGGEEALPDGMGSIGGVVFFSIAGYGIAILISLYILWTFGRTDDASIEQIAMMITVVSFPASLGAAAARLIL